MMRIIITTGAALLCAAPAMAQSAQMQSGSAGGLQYQMLTSPDGCSSANPCRIVTFLHHLGGENQVPSDLQTYFNTGAFWSANPHTIVVAPQVNGSSNSNHWGGVGDTGVSPNMTAAVAAVKQVQATYATDPNNVTVTGGSMGGIGTQAALIQFGPKGVSGEHVFTAGLAYDGSNNQNSTAQKDALCGVPLTIVHGGADTTVSPEPDRQLANTLSGCPGFSYVEVPGAGHGTWSSPAWGGFGDGTLINQTLAAAGGGSGFVATPAVPYQTPATPVSNAAGSIASPAAASLDAIGPGGSLTDADGNLWAISGSGSIERNGALVAGGGETSALTVEGGKVYGLDSTGRGWFELSSGDYWISTPAPVSAAASTPTPVADTSIQAPVTATSTPALVNASIVSNAGTCLGSSATSTPAFGILPIVADGVGQIYDPNQKPFIPRGINTIFLNASAVNDALSLFPGINFVRAPIYDYDADPATYADAVQKLTSAGVVVEFEGHKTSTGGQAGGAQGTVFTGALLAQEQAFYARFATYYKGNPYVWWGTNNEPPNAGAALSAWQLQTYKTIRDTGNPAPILLEITGWATPSSFGQDLDHAAYAQMSNVIWDVHFYGWLTKYTGNQSANESFITAAVAQTQKLKSAGGVTMPVIVGEYGDSTTGRTIDQNGMEMVKAVHGVAQSGVVTGTAAWAHGHKDPGDRLMNGGGLSPYGQVVASHIAQSKPAATSVAASCQAGATAQTAQTTTSSPTTPSTNLSVTTQSGAPTSQPDASTPQVPAVYQEQSASADQASTNADKQIADIQAQIAALEAASKIPSIQAVGAVK